MSVPSHTSERRTDTKDTAFQCCSCWQACSLPRCLEQTHGLAEYAEVILLCPVCPLCRCFDAPWHENPLCLISCNLSQTFDLAGLSCCTLPLCASVLALQVTLDC